MSTKALWYLTRGSGIVSLVLLTAAVVLGLLTAGRFARERWPRFLVEGLHRNVSLLASVFLLIHIATAVLDGFVPIHWLDAVVPFGAAYRPFWLGLGALSLDLFIAVAATSLVRRHLGLRVWRAVHWSVYACWLFAMLHSFGAGSDSGQGWMILIYLVCGAAVLCALAWRLAVTAKVTVAGRTRPEVVGPVRPLPLTATERRREV